MSDSKQVKKYKKYIEKYLKKYVPSNYNQLELLNELCNDELDYYMSITNRGDGKSFNYFAFFLKASIDLELKPCFVVRHFTLQQIIKETIKEICDVTKVLDRSLIWFRNTDDYVLVGYNDKELAIITDLNNASDLKFSSTILKNFPIMIYDEFLALEGDYIPDEMLKIKMIYQSIDRIENRPLIKHPKIFLLGNPVNFDSPVLAELDLFYTLQTHEINTIKQYDNVLLELRRNDNVNEKKNNRIFGNTDSKFTGQFHFDTELLLSKEEFDTIKYKGKSVRILISPTQAIACYYYDKKYVLAIEKKDGKEDYSLSNELSSLERPKLRKNSYSERHIKLYDNFFFYFNNAYSKNKILSDNGLMSIKIEKLLKNNEKTVEEIVEEKEHDRILRLIGTRFE